jgi:hypothetical protein
MTGILLTITVSYGRVLARFFVKPRPDLLLVDS